MDRYLFPKIPSPAKNSEKKFTPKESWETFIWKLIKKIGYYNLVLSATCSV